MSRRGRGGKTGPVFVHIQLSSSSWPLFVFVAVTVSRLSFFFFLLHFTFILSLLLWF